MSDQNKHMPLDSQKLQSNSGVTSQVQKKKKHLATEYFGREKD